MTTIPAPGADLATDERALFDAACREYKLGVITPYDLDFAWSHFQGHIWRSARAALTAVPASQPVGEVGHVETTLYKRLSAGTKLYAAAPAPVSGMPAEPILPQLPSALYKHPKLGDMFDRMQMHFYAVKHTEGLARLLDAAGYAPPANAVSGMPDSRPLHVAMADEPQVDERCRYFWRTGWNAYRNAILALPAPDLKAVSGMPDLASLQRFDSYGNESGGGVQESPDGEYVLLADVERLLNPAKEPK